MRNGYSGTGNSDLFYVGQKNQSWGETEVDEVDDANDVVAVWGDDALPAGGGHSYENFQFRYVDGIETASSGDIDGLEIMS